MDVSKVSNNSVDELYGDIDDMYVSQSSCVPITESDGSVVSSVTLCTSEAPSSTRLNGTEDDTVNDTDRNSESNVDFDDDDFNLYDETIGEAHQNKTDTYNELKKQCEALMSRLSHLETENQSLHVKFDKTEQENMEAKRNIARLLLTTKGEISRKDKEIATLRQKLSVSPRGRRTRMLGTRASAVASTSLSSVDSDFDPLCVSSPGRVSTNGKTTVPRHSSARFQSNQENVSSPLAKERADRASTRGKTSIRGRLDTMEVAGIDSDESRSVERHSRSRKDSGNRSKETRDKIDVGNEGNDKRLDSSNKTDKTKKLENGRKKDNSNSERGQKKDSENIHRLDRRKEYVSSSDRDMKETERKERSDRISRSDRVRNRSGDRKNVHAETSLSDHTDIDDKQVRTKLNAKSNVMESTSADTDKVFESESNKQRERKKSGNERTRVVSTESSVENGLKRHDRKVDLRHSLKSRIQIVNHDDTTERESSTRPKERDRNKSVDDRKKQDLESNSECVESNKSQTKTPVLDLREKLRQRRLKAAGGDLLRSPERVSENCRNVTKSRETEHVKDSILEAKTVGDSKFLNANDILESCVSKESFMQDVAKAKPNTETPKSQCLKDSGKIELNRKPITAKQNISEDLEFLNKLKSSIRKESTPTLSNSKTVPTTSVVSMSVNLAGSDISQSERKFGDETNKDFKELGEITDDSDDGVEGTFSECDDSSDENDDIDDSVDENDDIVDKLGEYSKQDDILTDKLAKISVLTHIENFESENKDQVLTETPITANTPVQTQTENIETENEGQVLTETHKSDCEENSSVIQTVCNKPLASEFENTEYIQTNLSDIPSQNLQTEKISENSANSSNVKELVDKVKSCPDMDIVSGRTDLEECSGNYSDTWQDSDQSGSVAGVSSETISSCTSAHMSKSVMEFFQTLDDRPETKSTKHTTTEMCSKSNTSNMDKPFTCKVKNCSIKMRHLHPKQSNKKTVSDDSDMVENQCNGVKNSKTSKSVSPEPCADKPSVLNNVTNTDYSTTANRSSSMNASNTIERSQHNSEVKSSGSSDPSHNIGMVKDSDTNGSKTANQILKVSTDKDNSEKLAPNALTGTHKEGATIETHTEATIGTIISKDLKKSMLETNKPDVTEKQNVCESGPDVEMGVPEEDIAENESDGSFGSNIVSEKTESLQSSDESDDDSCTTCSDDSTSDGDVTDTDSSIDDTDYVTTDSHTDSDDSNDLSDLGEKDNEKLAVKATSSAVSSVSVKPTSENKSDSPTKEANKSKSVIEISRLAVPESKHVPEEISSKSVKSKISSPKAINATVMVNKEHGSDNKNSGNVKLHSPPRVVNKKVDDVQSRKSSSAIEIKTVERNLTAKRNTLAESEKSKYGVESSPNTRSNMLQQLLHCVQKEFKGRSPESIDSDKKCAQVNDSNKEGAKSEFSKVDDRDNETVRKDETAQSECLNIDDHDNEAAAKEKTVEKADHEAISEEGEVVTGVLNNFGTTTKSKDEVSQVTDRKTDTASFLHSEDTCHKLFGSPLSASSHSSSGSESDSDSSYSSHSTDCSTCSSYSSSSGSSSESDSEDEGNNKSISIVNHRACKTVNVINDNNKSVKQGDKEQNGKGSFSIITQGNIDKANKAISPTSDQNNEMVIEENDYMETDDLDMQPKVTVKTRTKSEKLRSPMKTSAAAVSESGGKLNHQTRRTPVLQNVHCNKSTSITKEISGTDKSNPSGRRNRACHNKSGDGSSHSSSTHVSPQTPNPYLIEDETPEFLMVSENNAKSSNSHLPRDTTSTTSPNDGSATPAAKFASPKKFHAVNSQTVQNNCLGVISSVDNNKSAVSKWKRMPAVSSMSRKTDERTNSSSNKTELSDQTVNQDKCKHKMNTTKSRSRNNSQQSKITDYTENVTKESTSGLVKTKRDVPVKSKSGTESVKAKSETIPVKTKSSSETMETKSGTKPDKIVPAKSKLGAVLIESKTIAAPAKTISDSLPVESKCRKSSVTNPSSAHQKKGMKPITKSQTKIENKTLSESQQNSKNQEKVETSVPQQILRRSPRKKCSVSQTSLPVNRNEKKPVASEKDRSKGIAGELFGQALSGCKLPVVKNKSDNIINKHPSKCLKAFESKSEVDNRRSNITSESRSKVDSSRSRKISETDASKSRKASESRSKIDEITTIGKNVNKTNVCESSHKQLDNVGKKSAMEKIHGKSSAGINLRKSDSVDKLLDGKTTQKTPYAERTRKPSGDVQKSRKPSGDVQKSRKLSGDVQKSRKLSDDVQKSRKLSGDVQKSQKLSGDVQKSQKLSGDVQKSRKLSGDVHKHNKLDCEAIVELTDCKSIDKRSTEESVLRQSDKNKPITHEIKKCSTNTRTRNASGHSNDGKIDSLPPKSKSIESVRLNKKGTSNVTDNRKRHPSSTLPSPLKRFTIPKLKRKASTSPEDKKISEKRRKPLQTVSPTKSPSPICLRRTCDGQWSKTKSNSNTLILSEIVDSSSSDESSEGSSIINALFGTCSENKDVISNETERKSEKDSSSVKDSGSKEKLTKLNEDTKNKNKELTTKSSNKDNNIKSVAPPVLFLDEHTMDRTDYEDMLCLDNCEDTFDDDLSTCSSNDSDSNASLEDGEVSSASESENKTQQVPAVPKTKSVKTPQKICGPENVSSKSNTGNKCDKTGTNDTTSTTRKFDEGNKGTEVTRRRYNDTRRSPNYRRRGRYRSRSPIDFKRSSRSSYDRDRKYSRNDPHFSPRDRRVRTPNKRRRSISRNRDTRDSDSFREKRRNTSTRS